MAILLVRETGDNRGSSLDQEFTQEMTRTFIVISDIVDEVPQDVQFATDPNTGESIPRIGEIFGGDIDCFVTSVRPRQDRDCPDKWTVEVEYSSQADPLEIDPLTRPAEIEWDEDEEERPVETAKLVRITNAAGQPALGHPQIGKTMPPCNTAGDPFDPPPMKDDGRTRITITKIVQEFPRDLNTAYRYTQNADAIWGFAPGQLRVRNIKGVRFKEQGRYYFRITVVLEARREGWDRPLLNQGFRAWKDVGGAKRKTEIRDTNGSQASNPKLLTIDGEELSINPGEAPEAVYLHWEYYPKTVFAALRDALGLPDDLHK